MMIVTENHLQVRISSQFTFLTNFECIFYKYFELLFRFLLLQGINPIFITLLKSIKFHFFPNYHLLERRNSLIFVLDRISFEITFNIFLISDMIGLVIIIKRGLKIEGFFLFFHFKPFEFKITGC